MLLSLMSRRRIAQAATVIMLGNLATSVLGFVRQFVTGTYFHGPQTAAWFAAYTVPQMFYDLVIGGAVAAAMIPTFTRLAEANREDFWRVVTTVFLLAAAVILILIGILELSAAPLMSLIAAGFQQKGGHRSLVLSIELVRVILPTLFFWGLSAVALAALYAVGRRVAASFATACFHLGIIVAAILLGHVLGLGIVALPIGAVAGAASQFLVQVPSLWQTRRSIATWIGKRVDFHDPAVRRILILYGPVAAGILVSMAGQIADLEFKSQLRPVSRLSDMQYATTLIQFPVGIIVAALGLAVLPMISSDAAAQRMGEFKQKLGLGFRVVLVLMVPSALGFVLLGQPIATLLFHHGDLSAGQTAQIARSLLGYAPQLPFIGIDQLLIFAFYARQNTVTPMLAGVLGVCVYVAFAFLLFPMGVLGLAIANTLQITVHAILLLVLLTRAVGWIEGRELGITLGKVAVAVAAMSGAILLVQAGLSHASLGRFAVLWNVAIPMAAAIGAYCLALYVVRLDEVGVIRDAVVARIKA